MKDDATTGLQDRPISGITGKIILTGIGVILALSSSFWGRIL